MSWDAITQAATAITTIAGAGTAIYTLGRQLGIWRGLRQWWQRQRRRRRQQRS
jgi:hypothetical protein